MIAAGRGAIVNTASQWGLHPAPGHIAYNVSKAAVVSFTQNLARDYAPYNVRVNAVCPDEIHTHMLESGLARKGLTVADLDKKVPFGRIGRPEEVAALVAFLASDEAPFTEGAIAELPLGEVTPPEDVAKTMAFLASGRARHATGATVDITGADYVR